MARYRFKNGLVDAEQFTGGVENGQKIVNWLKTKDIKAEHWERRAVEEYDISLDEELALYRPKENFGFKRSAFDTVKVGQWIVVLGSRVIVYSDEEFKEVFDKS